MSHISQKKYSDILKVLPILCVDIVVCNSLGEYLLVKRTNEPMKDEWWVIGGRVYKGETLAEAVKRKVKQEIGIEVDDLQPIGYFEIITNSNPFALPFKYHAVSVVFKICIDDGIKIKLDNQSIAYKFSKKLPPNFFYKPFDYIDGKIKRKVAAR